jgi:hypothetical protein
MYPEGIPDWLRSQFEGDIEIAENSEVRIAISHNEKLKSLINSP